MLPRELDRGTGVRLLALVLMWLPAAARLLAIVTSFAVPHTVVPGSALPLTWGPEVFLHDAQVGPVGARMTRMVYSDRLVRDGRRTDRKIPGLLIHVGSEHSGNWYVLLYHANLAVGHHQLLPKKPPSAPSGDWEWGPVRLAAYADQTEVYGRRFGYLKGYATVRVVSLSLWIPLVVFLILPLGLVARRRVRGYVRRRRGLCESCGYSLRGLTEARCPECGTPFTQLPQTPAVPSPPATSRRDMWGARELARDSEHYVASQAVGAKRESGPDLLRKQWRRYRMPGAIAAGFLLLAGLVATASHWWLAEQERQQPAPSSIDEDEQESTAASILSLKPESPARLRTALEPVWIKFSYRTSEPNGVVIDVWPMSKALKARGRYSVTPLPVYPSGTGTGETSFTVSRTCVVDQLRIRIYTTGKVKERKLLHESFHPVHFTFEGTRGKAAIPPVRGEGRPRGQEGPRDPGN